MARRGAGTAWAKAMERSVVAITRSSLRAGATATRRAVAAGAARLAPSKPPAGAGDWLPGMALGVGGMRRYRLYRPPGLEWGKRYPLMVMLHGCGQDAASFAQSTRMNRIALREQFLVLYPEQDRLANAQGCWNWFDTRSGRAAAEAELILNAIDQVCVLYPVDAERVAVAGLSAGASMAGLLVTRHPGRFRALVMHSGVPPGSAHSGLSAIGAMGGRRSAGALDATPEVMAATWPPLMVIHGGGDRVVALGNAQEAVRLWADAAGARAVPARSVQRGKRYPMVITEYRRPGRDTVATLVEIPALGHAWSGGAKGQAHSDGLGPDASRMAWAFSARQFQRTLAS